MAYVFVSYSTKHQQIADATRELFHKKGIETWMAYMIFRLGLNMPLS